MVEKVYQYIIEHKMVKAGGRILVGVSGGADSTCLLRVLHRLAPRLDLSLEVLHVHHMIRGEEADRDAAFVEGLCRKWQLPYHLVKEDVPAFAAEKGLSMETAAREIRYEMLEAWRKKLGADVIAVAHHKGDQAETVLLHLFRGSGLEGLGGMLPVRCCIVRPLLCVTRQEIEAFLAEENLAFCQDQTNEENEATRNKLRNVVLPYVKAEVNAGVEENLLRASRMAKEAHAYLQKQAGRMLAEYAVKKDGGIGILAACAEETDPIVLSYMIRAAVEECKGDVFDLTERHVKDVESLFRKAQRRQLDLPGKLRAYRQDEWVVLTERPFALCGEKGEYPLQPLEMRTFSYDFCEKIPENRYTKWFDYDKIKDCVTIRHRREGDYLSIAPTGTKSLRRFFIDNKIPREERESCTLVADGSHILWVVGYRISEEYKVTRQTKTILEITIKETKDEREN
ncbi:MAG: tRNA lysidine(34) synthetase TilS [Lachnospiraceae bacterium]|nr:tRNA lysidine(34) synthetase TilS [Lachnospiraceae bacterium]